jgi:hypothetical protein
MGDSSCDKRANGWHQRPLERIGELGRSLFGERWEAHMADVLGVPEETVRRWATGESEPTPQLWRNLGMMCLERARELERAAEQLEERAA